MSSWSRATLASALALACLSPSLARAHEVGLSRGDYTADGAAIVAEIAFARKELIGLVAGLDGDHDGALTEAELRVGLGSIEGAVVSRVKVEGDGGRCEGKLVKVELAEQDGVLLRASYRCAKRPAEARIALTLLDDLPFGHRHLVRAAQAEGPLDLVLSQRAPTFAFRPPPAPVEAKPEDAGSTWMLGAKHAARAWTCPVFLIGLLARARGRAPAIAAVCAFLAASAAGIAASSSGLFTPSPRALGAAIALSLVYVGVDALADSGAPDRAAPAWTALPFGVVHGLALAASRGAGAASVPFATGSLLVMATLAAGLVPSVLWARARHPSSGRVAGALALLAGVAALARGLL